MAKRERLAWAFNWFATALALGSWSYTVVAPEPNLYLGSALFFLCAISIIAAICVGFAWGLRYKIISAILLLAVFTLGNCQILAAYRAKKLAEQQDDAYRYLDAKPTMPSDRQIFHSGVIVANGGGSKIAEGYTIQCQIRRIVMSPAGGIMNLPMQTTLPDKAGLEPYGDGDTSYCFAGIQQFPGTPVCADITVDVSYSLEAQPSVNKTKAFRFVAQGNDFAWLPRPVKHAGEYCPEPKPPNN